MRWARSSGWERLMTSSMIPRRRSKLVKRGGGGTVDGMTLGGGRYGSYSLR